MSLKVIPLIIYLTLMCVVSPLYAKKESVEEASFLNEYQKANLSKKLELIELRSLKESCPHPYFSNWLGTSGKRRLPMIEGCEYLAQKRNLKQYKFRFVRNFLWLNYEYQSISRSKEKVFWSYFNEVKKLAKHGDLEAIYTLAEVYRQGVKKISKPISINLDLSEKFYKQAIDGNLCMAMSMKAFLLHIQFDFDKSKVLLRKSAACGDGDASLLLSLRYSKSKDREQVRKYHDLLYLAVENGIEDAIERTVEIKLSSNKINEAYEQFCKLSAARRYGMSLKIVKKYKINQFNNIGCGVKG